MLPSFRQCQFTHAHTHAQSGLRDPAFSTLQHLEEHVYDGAELINLHIYNTMLLVRVGTVQYSEHAGTPRSPAALLIGHIDDIPNLT